MYNFTFNSRASYIIYKADWKQRLEVQLRQLRLLRQKSKVAQQEFAKAKTRLEESTTYGAMSRAIEAAAAAAQAVNELYLERQASKIKAAEQMTAKNG